MLDDLFASLMVDEFLRTLDRAVTKTITVGQYYTDPRSEERYKYVVETTTNTTSPKLGDALTEREVNSLIQRGYRVVIRRPK